MFAAGTHASGRGALSPGEMLVDLGRLSLAVAYFE